MPNVILTYKGVSEILKDLAGPPCSFLTYSVGNNLTQLIFVVVLRLLDVSKMTV